MGARSLKKKRHGEHLAAPQASSMAAAANSPPRRNKARRPYATVSVLLSGVLFVSVAALLFISSNKWRAFGNYVSYEMVNVVNEFPHDPEAFTQGLLYAGNDTLFESTGLYGRSSVRRVALHTGKVEELQRMGDSLFGEGLTLLDKRLFQVTWLQKVGFIYDQKTLGELGTFNHEMKDGWGLATDGKVLFGSDGSSTLYQLDPRTFKALSKHTIYYKDQQVYNLNELEYIDGEVWANVFTTDCIVRISPNDGRVLGWILLPNLRKGLIDAGYTAIDVLNGIAWDRQQKRIFVTGKLWPKLYEIKNLSSLLSTPIFFGIPLWVLLVSSIAAFILTHHATFQNLRRTLEYLSSEDDLDDHDGAELLQSDSPEFKGVMCQHFQVEELEDATNGFAERNVIESGDNGTVYRGLLANNMKVVVKKLPCHSCQPEDSFASQVELTANAKHKRLVKLIGYSTNRTCRLLVSEYIDNGNLHKWLHEFQGSLSPLTWPIRLHILQAVAHGIAYLHEEVEPKIIHGSIKSRNILLDQQWNPKISDFGLFKLQSSNSSHSMSNFTESNDIYDFGILIMETISGRIPFPSHHSQPQAYIVDWFKSMISSGKISDLVDPKLPKKPSSIVLKRIILLALWCVDLDMNPKLKMEDVVQMLESNQLIFYKEHHIAMDSFEQNFTP
ncbi:Glutaminyl-peptide cyclotransferase [Arachis hypogaea]|nr:Glutaminyl-peptide cyclotransferase [Arachis hypogaea]